MYAAVENGMGNGDGTRPIDAEFRSDSPPSLPPRRNETVPTVVLRRLSSSSSRLIWTVQKRRYVYTVSGQFCYENISFRRDTGKRNPRM